MANGGNIKFGVSFDVDQNGISKLKSSLQELSKLKVTDMVSTKNLEDAKKDLAQVKSTAAEVEKALNNAFNTKLGTTNISKFNAELNKIGLGKIQSDFEKAGAAGRAAFRQITNEATSLNTKIKQSNKVLDDMATTMKNTIKWNISSQAMNSITGSIQQAYKYIKNLDTSLNNIRIVSGQSADQMADFAIQANNAAKALGSQTTNYTNAALIYYQQGLNSEQVEARTNATIKMANVTGDSAEEVSSYMTAIWNNFDDGSQSLEHYADVITALGASTASSSAEISEGLEKFASIGETVGLSYDYATSALATVVANTRQSADTVGTAFKTIFSRLQGLKLGESLEDGTDLNKYSQALDAIGVNIKDQNGELKQMDTILDETAAKWGTLTQDQKMAMAQTVAGTRQYTQLISLLDNWGDMEKNLETAANAEGALQEQQDIYMDSLKAHLEGVKASSEDLYDSLLDSDSFKNMADGLSSVIDVAADFVDTLGGGGKVIETLGAIALRVFSAQITKSIQGSITNVRQWIDDLKTLKTAFSTSADEEKIANTAEDERTANLMGFKKDLNTARDRGLISDEEYDEGKKVAQEYADKSGELEAWEQKNQQASEYLKKMELISNQEINSMETLHEDAFELANAVDQAKILEKTFKDISSNTNDSKKIMSEYAKNIAGAKSSNKDEDLQGQLKSTRAAFKNMEELNEAMNRINESVGKQLGEEMSEKLRKITGEISKFAEESKKNLDNNIIPTDTSKFNDIQVKLAELSKIAKQEGLDVKTFLEMTNEEIFMQGESLNQEVVQLEDNMSSFRERFKEGFNIQGIVNGIGAIGTFAMGIESCKNGLVSLGDESKTTGEKISGFIMGITMGIPMIVSSFGALGSLITSIGTMVGIVGQKAELTVAEAIAGLLGLEIQAGATFGSIITELAIAVVDMLGFAGAEVTAVGATGDLTVSILGLEATLSPLVVLAIAVGAALIGIGAATAIIVKVTKTIYEMANATEIAAEKAAEAAKVQQEAYEKTKQAYDELKASIEDYQGAADALSNMTKGTDEWKQAVLELNEQVLSLMNTYPELAKYISNEDGVLKISEGGLDAVLDSQLEKVNKSAAINYTSQAAKEQTEANLNLKNAADTGSIILNADVAKDVSDGNIAKYMEQLEKTSMGQDKANEYLGNLVQSANEYMAHQEAATQNQSQAIESYLASRESSSYDESKYQDAIKAAMTSYGDNEVDTSEYSDRGIFGKNDSTIQKEYAELMGYNTTKIDNGKGEATYYNDKGEEVATISDEVVETVLAQQKKLQESADHLDAFANSVDKLANSAGEMSKENEAVSQALASLAGGKDAADISGLTKKQVKEFSQADVDSMSDEDIKNLGFDSKDQLQAAIDQSVAEANRIFEEGFNDISSEMKNHIQSLMSMDDIDFEDLTVGGQKALADAYQKMFDSYGDAGTNTLDEILKGAGKYADTVANIMSDIDWSSEDASKQLNEALADAHIKLPPETVGDLSEKMMQINGAFDSVDTSKLQEEIAGLKDALDMKIGDTISDEDYLEKFGEDFEEFFTTLDDGTHMLIKSAEEFQDAVKNKIKAESDQNFERTKENLVQDTQTKQNADKFLESDNLDVKDVSKDLSNPENIKSGDGTEEYQNQLKFIEQMNTATEGQIKTWQTAYTEYNKLKQAYNENPNDENLFALNDAQEKLQGSAKEMASAADEAKEKYNGLDDSITKDREELLTAQEQFAATRESINELNGALADGSINQEQFEKNLDRVTQAEAEINDLDFDDVVDQGAALAKQYGLTAAQGRQLSIENQRMNKGIATLNKNFATWKKTLQTTDKTSIDNVNAMQDMNAAVVDLVGASKDLKLPREFFDNADNMELIGKAAEGDTDAINELGTAVAYAQVEMMEFNNAKPEGMSDMEWGTSEAYALGQAFESSKETVLNGIQAMQEGLDGLSIGDNVYDKLGGTDWVDALNTMAYDTEMSVEQMNSMLNSMGVQADVTTQTKKVQTNVPQYVTEETVEQTSAGEVDEDGVSTKPATYKKTSHTYQDGTVPVTETIEVAAIGTGKNPPKITYTGNGGAAPSSTGGGKKGGGGGGKKSGKKNNAKVNKRADKEEAPEKDSARYEDEFNYYFREEKILNKVTDALEKLQDAQNGLHGAELVNNLKEQNNQLEDQKKALDGVIEKTKKLSAEYQHKKDNKKTGIQYNDYVKAYNQNNDWDYYQKLMKNRKKLSDSDKDKLKEYQDKYGKKGSNKYKKYAKKAKKDKQLEYAYEAQKAGSYAKAMTTVKKLKPKKKLSKKEEKRLKAAKEVLKDSAAETAFYEASSGEKLSKKEKKAFKTINKYSGKKKLSKKEKSALTKAAKKLGGKVTKVKGKYKIVGGKTVKDIAKFQKSDTFKAEKNAKNYDKYTELKKKKPKDLTKKDKKALKNLEKKFDTKQKKGLKGKTAKAKEKARATKARKNVANAKAFKQAIKGITTSEKNDLSDFGIKFDKDGKMTTDSYEKVTKREYNKMEAAKEDLKNGKITEEQYEKIEKRYETLKELTEKQKEAEDKINEKLKERNKILDQQIENNRAAWQEKIDINVNFNNAKKEWNNLKADFEKNGLNSSTPKSLEWSKNNNFIGQQSNISADAAVSDFNSDKANFNVYKDSAQEALGEFDYYSNGGEKTSNMIYKSKSDALDALKKYQTELNASLQSMMDDYNNANQALLDGISEYKEQLSKIDDGYERINTKLERMSKLNTLINGNGAKGRDNNIEIAKAKQGNAKNQLESAVAESSKMKSLYDKAIQDGNKDAAEQYYAAWQEAEGKVSSSIEAVAEAADELFNQKLNKSIETFYSTLSDNKFTSLGDMKEDWEDSTKNVEEYLDSVTRVYKQQTLMSKVQKSIDSTSNSGHREELEAFYKKENEALKNKQKLTQYDIDLAEKKYNILLKQQALEDAMNNKDSMKMARGADGNWSYQYVADDSKIKEAQQAVSDGWYELYELTNNAYKDNVDQIMSLTEEMESKIREVYANETLSIEQKNEKAKVIEEEYSNWITSLSQQNAQIQNDLNFATVGNLTQAVMINADNLNSLTEQEKEAVQTGIEAFKGGIMEYETEFESTTSKLKEVGKEAMESTRTDINTEIQQMIDKIAGPGGEATFKGAINAMGESIKTAMTDYANSINDAYGKTDTTLKNMSSDLTTLTGDSDKLKAKTTEICTAMGNDYDKLGGKLKILREQLSGTYNDAEALNNRILQLSQNEVNETNNAPSHLGMPLVQGDNKLEVGDNVVVKAGAWRYKGDKKGDLLKKDDRAYARKHSKSTKDVAYQLKGSHCDLTITKVKGNWAKIKDGKGGVRDGSWIHKKHLVGFDTGGYTGDWGNTDGKLALLHQKEIVLNKADTSNMLEIVKIVRGLVEGGGFINTLKDSIAQSIAQLSASAVSSSFGGITNNSTDNSTNSNQNITLYADFPNANDVSEIKEALLSLPNLAAQYISQK